MRWEVSGHTVAVLWDAASRICSKQHAVFLSNSHLLFFFFLLKSKWYNHTIILAWLQLGRICFILSEIKLTLCMILYLVSGQYMLLIAGYSFRIVLMLKISRIDKMVWFQVHHLFLLIKGLSHLFHFSYKENQFGNWSKGQWTGKSLLHKNMWTGKGRKFKVAFM